MNSDFVAAVSPMLRELAAGWNEGRKDLCLTIESEDNRNVWMQILPDTINIGLIDAEDDKVGYSMIRSYYPRVEEDGYEKSKYWTGSATINCNQTLLKCIYSVFYARGHNSDRLNFTFTQIP